MRIVLLGPPGAGKGTQARRLADRYRLSLIATGDLFRWNVKEGTDLGRRAERYLDAGELVPDDVTIGMVMAAIDQAPYGFILDGFPRNVAQAESLETELATRARPLSAALAFILDEEEAIKRIAGRRTCANCQTPYNVFFSPSRTEGVCDLCGGPLIQRSDEDEDTVRRRLEVYRESTAPLLKFYSERGLLREVDAAGTEEQVTERAVAALADLAGEVEIGGKAR
ncbi:MAG TPA: adenylate kinase [Actinomycetota bacterium]|nr:adenylate kinase [Actinomycetota bacterium]